MASFAPTKPDPTAQPKPTRAQPRPTLNQILGVLLVVSGVCLASLPPTSAAAALIQPGDWKYVLLCVVSFAFPAFTVIIKQQIFQDYRRRMGRDLEVLVVNAFGSTAQVGVRAVDYDA